MKWLIFFRILFSLLLLGSSVLFHYNHPLDSLPLPVAVLYGTIASIWIVSFVYMLMLHYDLLPTACQAYLQTGVDTVIVTVITILTGSALSFFSFLYLMVIICASILLCRRGSLCIASLCSLEYAAVFAADHFQALAFLGIESISIHPEYGWKYLLYKIPITIGAFYAVAFLSSLLAEQAAKSRQELLAMEAHFKRVEKMAAVGEMAAGLAHEIKNPLAAIMGSVHLIHESRHDEPDHDRLTKIIMREGDRLTTLVNNFLLFAKPPQVSHKVIEIEKAVSEVVDLLEKDPLIQRRIRIVQKCHPDVHAQIDPDHFHQVLSNLLLNSAESIPSSGRIIIQTHRESPQRVRLSVADTGCGISPQHLKTIFNPFFTTKPNGTGLGLSIVHRILEAYNIRLDVRSYPQGGTIFNLLFKT